MSNNSISCIILAGGKSVRFDGHDKGLVKLDNKPLVSHVIDRVQPQLDDIIISANRNIKTYKHYSPLVIADDTSPYQGPLAGISAALSKCKHEWVLIVPCDMPFLPENLVEQLQAGVVSNHKLSIAKVNDRLQLALLINKSLLDSIRTALTNEHNKVMQWVDSQQPAIVEFFDGDCFANINSVEELNQSKQRTN